MLRRSSGAAAYFVREGVELILIVAGLLAADHWWGIAWWVWLLVLVTKASLSIGFYVAFVRPALRRAPHHALAAWTGRNAYTASPLRPAGWIRARGESWRAESATGCDIPLGRRIRIREYRDGRFLVDEVPDEDPQEAHR